MYVAHAHVRLHGGCLRCDARRCHEGCERRGKELRANLVALRQVARAQQRQAGAQRLGGSLPDARVNVSQCRPDAVAEGRDVLQKERGRVVSQLAQNEDRRQLARLSARLHHSEPLQRASRFILNKLSGCCATVPRQEAERLGRGAQDDGIRGVGWHVAQIIREATQLCFVIRHGLIRELHNGCDATQLVARVCGVDELRDAVVDLHHAGGESAVHAAAGLPSNPLAQPRRRLATRILTARAAQVRHQPKQRFHGEYTARFTRRALATAPRLCSLCARVRVARALRKGGELGVQLYAPRKGVFVPLPPPRAAAAHLACSARTRAHARTHTRTQTLFHRCAARPNMDWLYSVDGASQGGPVPTRVLLRKLAAGDVDGLTLVWSPAAPHLPWRAIADTPALVVAAPALAAEAQTGGGAPALGGEWFYSSDGAQTGPLSLAHLALAVAECKVSASTLVWCAGMPQWQPAAACPQVAGLLFAAPPGTVTDGSSSVAAASTMHSSGPSDDGSSTDARRADAPALPDGVESGGESEDGDGAADGGETSGVRSGSSAAAAGVGSKRSRKKGSGMNGSNPWIFFSGLSAACSTACLCVARRALLEGARIRPLVLASWQASTLQPIICACMCVCV
ncbi:MAG: DUF4339 domain-containing protein [Methanobacteriota archaeon]|nr:MAG: DUF4339 domain-containing protein [Euryarchaeota archaeon]